MADDTKTNGSDGSQLNALPALEQARSIVMSNEMFEKLYLNPPNKVSGDLRRVFANPTPL